MFSNPMLSPETVCIFFASIHEVPEFASRVLWMSPEPPERQEGRDTIGPIDADNRNV